jgi:Tfp pilus assembly protein PilN
MIAPRRAEKHRMERDMRRLAILVLAELVFAVGLGGWVITKTLTTRNRIADLDTQIAKLQPIVKQIKTYDGATSKLKPKLKLLNEAKDLTMRWYNTLDRLTESLPQQTYLTRVGTGSSRVPGKQDSDKTEMLIAGVSANQALVGETMLRMQAIPDLTEINLHYTKDTSLPEYVINLIGPRSSRQRNEIVAVEWQIGTEIKLGKPLKGAKNGRGQS